MTTLLESLGVSHEEMLDLVVERITGTLLNENLDLEKLGLLLQAELDRRVKAAIDAYLEEHVDETVTEMLNGAVLQETNRWGEAKGKPLTFREYLVARAESYLQEPVNWEGEAKGQQRGMGWQQAGPRILHIVHQHLHHRIESECKTLIQHANDQLGTALETACRDKLRELTDTLTVKVEAKR